MIEKVIYRFIYGESSTEELRHIKKHLDLCGHCVREKSIIEEILQQLKDGVEEEPLPDGLRDRVLEKIHSEAEAG